MLAIPQHKGENINSQLYLLNRMVMDGVLHMMDFKLAKRHSVSTLDELDFLSSHDVI